MASKPDSDSEPAILGCGIAKRFRSGRSHVEILKSVDFRALQGQLTMIMGPSGSGKSTLLAVLSGLLRPEAGWVRALGTSIWNLSPKQSERFRLRNSGFIFQGFNLSPALTALQQVSTILRYQGVSPREADARAEAALESVGVTRHLLDQKPSELSGGEKQRVSVARALAKEPRLLFADEPTSALDGENGRNVMRLLKNAAERRRAAVICVTHDIRLTAFADSLVSIEDGQLRFISA